MKKLIGIIILFLTFQIGFGHPWKPKHYAIVITDASPEELKAVPLLFASPSVQVLAILTHGNAGNVAKVEAMLNEIHHQGVLNAFFNENNAGSTHYIFKQILKYRRDSLTLINLSDPENLNELLDIEPDLQKQIKKTIQLNCTSSKMQSDIVNVSLTGITPSIKFTEQLAALSSPYGKFYAHNNAENKFTSEIAALFLQSPELFIEQSECFNLDKNQHLLTENTILELLSNQATTKNQIFIKFPVDTALYIGDVAEKTDKIIKKYGQEEWAACVLTSELHRHLGIYALIGAKMGVRAKNYFGAGVDEMKITTYAGQQPPVSCFNDGLQVSTGATIGHGHIHILDTAPPLPRAEFSYLGQTIAMQLKPEYEKRIKLEVKSLVIAYGTQSDEYWDLLRSVALNLWFSWDRNEIFTIEQLP